MSAWRERRQGAEPAPTSVARVVLRTTLSLRATRAVEALLFLVAGALCVRAAAEWGQRTEGQSGELWSLALVAGLLAGLAWWRAHPVSTLRVARALDRRLWHRGGLMTAFELERRPGGARSDMERLVSRRVLERLRLREALHALLPPLFVPIASPVAAALVLLLVLEARPPAGADAFDRARLVTGFEDALEDAIESVQHAVDAGAIDPEEARQGIRRLSEARREPWSEPAEPSTEAARLAADQALEQLEARALEVGDKGAFDALPLAEARAWLDALMQGSAAAEGGPPPVAGAGAEAGKRMEPGALAPGLGNGIMSRSAAGTEAPPPSSVIPSNPAPGVAAPSSARPRLGSSAGGTRWWPAAQNELVEAWIERSRAAQGQ